MALSVLLELKGLDKARELPEPIRLLLSIGLYQVSPYSWDKIAELLGFNPIALKEKLRALGVKLYRLDEEGAKEELEASRSFYYVVSQPHA